MRRSSLFAFVVLAACGPAEPAPEAMLVRAADYLWQQQAADGGWHSQTHGLLRGGQAWTPFVLHALLQVPEAVYAPPEEGAERALAFLRARITEEGVLGVADSLVMEYPNYATAYALRVFAARGAPGDAALVRRMATYLRGEQFTEARGIAPDHPAYGAWGFGETTLAPGEVGHLDLSHTRRVLQALVEADAADSTTLAAATRYLRLAQKHPSETRPQPPGGVPSDAAIYDGGFYASPVVWETNKGNAAPGLDGEPAYFRSYATATAEGLIALLAAGHAPASEPVRAAAEWLRAHPGWETPAGIPIDDPAQWHRVLFFYHLAVRAEAYDRLDEPGPWRDDLAALLAEHQHADGHFANPAGAPNKEDDPLLATAMMAETLARVVAP